MSKTEKAKELCLNLIRADSEAEVIKCLSTAGYWDYPTLWRWLGDEEYNYSSVGNQQSRAEQAIIEKLINSIDSKLIAAARTAGIDPESSESPDSILEARDQFFREQLTDPETLSRSITVTATGANPPGRPCFTIVDDGEGQTPKSMPKTILSLHAGNKNKIKFVQGKFNMGGTGVLEFCGMERNLQLIVSRRKPDLLPDPLIDQEDAHWCFTVVRREDPLSREKNSRYTYLAPIDCQEPLRHGKLLCFHADSLPIFPEGNEPYARKSPWGTLIKLYEYDAQRFRQNMMRRDSLMYRARLLLPEPALPIRFHECRAYKGHSGSFDTTMAGLISTLHDDYYSSKRDNVEWFDKLEFYVNGEQFIARIYLFKNKEAAETYRRDEGVVFAYNGQCHAVLTKDFFRRKAVKQDYLWHSLLVVIDCSQITVRAHEKLFMNSRDRLRDGDLRRKLEEELEDQLSRHEELRELASERRRRELSEKPKTSESMAKLIEKLLSKNPTLASLLGQGLRIRNPHKPETAGAGIAGFIGKRFPTKFHFKGHEPGFRLARDANLNSRVRIGFETDAADDYFKRDEDPGEFSLHLIRNGEIEQVTNYQRPRLHNGVANLSLILPDGAEEGDELKFEAQVTDSSRVDPFRNEFTLSVQAEKTNISSGSSTRGGSGSDAGSGKGSKGRGHGQSMDSYLDIPEPIPVYEKDWIKHEPKFDKLTAMRIKEPPDAKAGEVRYDYYINLDNIYLQSFMKARPKLASGMKLRFQIGMTLIALSLLHQEQMRLGKGSTGEDMPDDAVDVRDRVAEVTCALAPFLLPMIESVSELDEDADHLSESAGAAA